MSRSQHVHRYSDEIEHHGRYVEHVVGPVAPAGEKSVEVSEDFFGPKVDAAFAGIAVGQLDDGNSLGPEEEQQRDDPKPDGDAAIRRDRRYDVQIENGNNKEEHQVAPSKRATRWGCSADC